MTKISKVIMILLAQLLLIPGKAQDMNGTYQFLNLAPDAPVMAMGGFNTSWSNSTPGSFINNPALTADSMHNYAGINYLAFSGAFDLMSAYYHYKPSETGIISAGVRHFTTGDIEGYDAAGNKTGDFSVAQSAITVGYSLGQNNFRYGVNLHYINSGIASYQSNALAFSVGGVFKHPERDITVGASIHNVGFLLNDFTDTEESNLPWDIRIGASFKPEHMPFRFTVTGHHLFNFDLLNDEISSSSFREVLAHIVFGTQLVLSRNISIFGGYNHLVRQELKLQQTSGGAGFSYGLSWNTRSFQFAYGRGAYHIAGASHMLTLNMDFNRIFNKI